MSKLFFLSFTLFALVAIFIAPASAGAWKPGDTLIPCTDNCTFDDLLLLIGNLMTAAVFYSTIIASAVFVYAGIRLIISGPEQKTAMKNLLWDVVKGMIIIWASYLIVSTILTVLDVKSIFIKI